MRFFKASELVWVGRDLRLESKRGRLLASIQREKAWFGMWRIRMPNGRLSDMVNLSRAKDAARSLALAVLNTQEKPAEASPMRLAA
jgi:hypothetical protein